MNTRKFLASFTLGLTLLVSALPARAGIPVIDVANLAQAIQQVIAWGQQYQQMMQTIQLYQQQIQQMQTMTQKLDGMRNIGTILNDPSIRSSLPTEMQNVAALMTNPSALSSSPNTINSILSAFGVSNTIQPDAGRSNANGYNHARAIMDSTQKRESQLQQLATRVNSAADAKESLDLLNRNTLEVAVINNQLIQTLAAQEANRQADEMRRIAESQAFDQALSQGARRPIINYSY